MVAAPPVRGTRRPADRKQQILDRARALFVQDGFRNVSMADIAESVGVTAGALYRHFPHKIALLDAVMRSSIRDLGLDPDSTLEGAIEQATSVLQDRPYLSILWGRESQHLSAEASLELRGVIRSTTQGLGAIIQRDRTELTTPQAWLLGGGVVSVLGSLGHPSARGHSQSPERITMQAAKAITAVELTDDGPNGLLANSEIEPLSRRERLLQAAIQLFTTRGYHATSLGEIGAEVGVTGPNLYGYFDNKQAILAAVIERGVQGHWIDLTDVLRSNHSPDLALDAVVRAYVKRSRGWVGLSHAVKDDAKLLASYRDSEREYVAEWAHLLCAARPGLAEGEARARVVIALSMVDTLMRTKSLATPSGFLENTTRMALAVLHS